MKKILYTILTLSSCHSYQNFQVQAPPGTVISNLNNQQLAVVDNSGRASIKLERNGMFTSYEYNHFLQAQVPGSNLQVPFALDYKNHSRIAKRGLGMAMVVPGLIIELSGCLMIILAGENDDMLGIGAAMAGAGAAASLMGLPWVSPKPIDSDYDYAKQQTINNDLFPN